MPRVQLNCRHHLSINLQLVQSPCRQVWGASGDVYHPSAHFAYLSGLEVNKTHCFCTELFVILCNSPHHKENGIRNMYLYIVYTHINEYIWICIKWKGCFGAGIVTLKFNLLNGRLEAEESQALPPQDLNRWRQWRGSTSTWVYTHATEIETVFHTSRRGAMLQAQLDSSTRIVNTFIKCFHVFVSFLNFPDSAGK